jgi:tetratricopeptide (TPR) repeat protein
MPPKRTVSHLNSVVTTSYVTAVDDVEALDFVNISWAAVELKFQDLRALLSAPTTGLNASQAREEQKRVVSAAIARLLDRAQAECRRLLISGNAKAAVEGGLKTLKLKEEYYGAGSLQLVPAYFHLARTNQFMDKFKRAEEFLSLAQYEVLRHPEADISLNAELHQTFGLLYASDGKLDAALKQLTCSTYYLSCMHGPEHVLTSFGYFDLGNVFAAKSHMEHAMAFYDRVKRIWDMFLAENLQKALEGDDSVTAASFGEENVQDAAKMLRGIVGLQSERYGQVHPSPAYGEQVLGMFLLWSGDAAGGFETLLRSLEIYKRVMGERHPKCQSLRLLLVNHGFQVPEDTTGVLVDDEALRAQIQPPPSSATPSAAAEQPKSRGASATPAADSARPASQADNNRPGATPPATNAAGEVERPASSATLAEPAVGATPVDEPVAPGAEATAEPEVATEPLGAPAAPAPSATADPSADVGPSTQTEEETAAAEDNDGGVAAEVTPVAAPTGDEITDGAAAAGEEAPPQDAGADIAPL